MTEMEFMTFLEGKLKAGRLPMISGYVDGSDPEMHMAGRYIGGHSVLFEGHQLLTIDTILKMGRLLLNRATSIKTKEAILMILAHHPSQEALNVLKLYDMKPDRELMYFARLALDECEMWNE